MRKHSLIVSMVLSMSAAALLLAPVAAEAKPCLPKCQYNKTKEKLKDAEEAAKQAAKDAAEEAEEIAAAAKEAGQTLKQYLRSQLWEEFFHALRKNKSLPEISGMPNLVSFGNNVVSKGKKTTTKVSSHVTKLASTIVAASDKYLPLIKNVASASTSDLTGKLITAMSTGKISKVDSMLKSAGLYIDTGSEDTFVAYSMGLDGAVVGGAQASIMVITNFRGKGGAFVTLGGALSSNAAASVTPLSVYIYPKFLEVMEKNSWEASYTIGAEVETALKANHVAMEVVMDSTNTKFVAIGLGAGFGKGVAPAEIVEAYSYSWPLWVKDEE